MVKLATIETLFTVAVDIKSSVGPATISKRLPNSELALFGTITIELCEGEEENVIREKVKDKEN